jgi:hypothetical protein
MRTLTTTEIETVNAAAGIHLPYVINEAIEFGAMGVLINMMLHGVTAAAIGHGLLLGAGVGASYALVHSVIVL